MKPLKYLFVFTASLFYLGSLTLGATKPDASNTGPSGVLTNTSGAVIVTVAGTVIENRNHTGTFDIRANNVTIRNCRINANGGFRAIHDTTAPGQTGLLVEDCEIFGATAAGVQASNITIRRCEIRDCEDGMKAGNNMLVEDCYLHGFGLGPNSHGDGIQISNGIGITIRNCTFDMPPGTGGYTNDICVFMKEDFGPIDNVTIDSCWINGGGWSINIGKNGSKLPSNVRIVNNLFGRDAAFGPFSADPGVTDLFLGCNRWENTLAFIPNQNSTGDCGAAQTPVPPAAPTGLKITPGT